LVETVGLYFENAFPKKGKENRIARIMKFMIDESKSNNIEIRNDKA